MHKSIPKKVLPVEYGGKDSTIKELTGKVYCNRRIHFINTKHVAIQTS